MDCERQSLLLWCAVLFKLNFPQPHINLANNLTHLFHFFSALFQEEVSRLAALQPQVELLQRRLDELKGEKEGDEDSPAFLDADIDAFKEHYNKVLEDLRARERQLQLGRWRHGFCFCRGFSDEIVFRCDLLQIPPKSVFPVQKVTNLKYWPDVARVHVTQLRIIFVNSL